MHSWDRTLAEIRYPLFMMCHKLQAFKIRGGRELAGLQLSRRAETAIQILSLRALMMEIGSHNLFSDTVFFGGPNIQVSQNVVKSALEAL